MRSFPELPPLADSPEALLAGGHLWIQELVDAGRLRFRLREDGRIRFGDDERIFDGDPPPTYRAAVRHVRERLDRAALRTAVPDPSAVVFFGGSLHYRTVPYDFPATPPFLGFDVWDGTRGRYLPPGAVEGVYDRLGLEAVHAPRKELRAVDFDPGSYEFPDSNYYDGPAPGVVVRDKTGNRAVLSNPDVEFPPPDPIRIAPAESDPAESDRADSDRANSDRVESDPPPSDGSEPAPAGFDPVPGARELVSDDRIRRARSSLEAAGDPATVSAVVDRTVELVFREEGARLSDAEGGVDPGAVRSAVAERVRRSLDGE